MRTGKIRVWIDSAEHSIMKEHFQKINENLGGILDIEVATLEYGDYHLKPEGCEKFVVTFKEYQDFQNSFFNGHLMDEIWAMYMCATVNPKALIIARDENKRTPREIHQWVSSHWRKRNFLLPTFKFDSRAKAVQFMVDIALSLETINFVDRPIHRADDYNDIAGIYKFYGVGDDKAKQLAERYPIPNELFRAMEHRRVYIKNEPYKTKKAWKESRWWHGILGEKTAKRIEDLFLDGKPIPKRKRGAK